MKLDKFQQFVKDNYQDNDLNDHQIKVFVRSLQSDFKDEYQLYLVEWISNKRDVATITENDLSHFSFANINDFNRLRKKAVCIIIHDTLAEIEDIEAINKEEKYGEDCMDTYKRAQELNQ